MKRWELYFYVILAAIPVLIMAGGFAFGVDGAFSAFVGAFVVSLNFAVLAALGRYIFRHPKRRVRTALLLIAHVFIAPALLASAIYFAPLQPIIVLIAALLSATISPMSLAILGLLYTSRGNTLAMSVVTNEQRETA
ncbi:MAG: hypothetical protein GY771_02995 [bacterium]|nr:hypothetical protein [bacterium]